MWRAGIFNSIIKQTGRLTEIKCWGPPTPHSFDHINILFFCNILLLFSKTCQHRRSPWTE